MSKNTTVLFFLLSCLWFAWTLEHFWTRGEYPASALAWPAIAVVVLGLSLSADAISAFIRSTYGPIEYLQHFSPAFEEKICARYRREIGELKAEGFNQVFFFAESFSIFRVFLVIPAITIAMMAFKREVVTVQDGKFLIAYPVFATQKKSAFANPFGLGVKFHTGLDNGTLLVSKTFNSKAEERPFVVQYCRVASISEVWNDHQQRIRRFEEDGKRVVLDNSFQYYCELTGKE